MRRLLSATLLVFTTFGCASTQSNLKKDIEVIEHESRADRLIAQGDGYAALGDMTRAEQYFAAALRNGGEAGGLTRKLIAVCVADGRYPSALEHASDYLRKRPHDVEVHFAAAALKQALGDVEGARAGLVAVIEESPTLAEAHFALGVLEKQQGNVIDADASFRAYLDLAPNGEHAEEARAGLMKRVGAASDGGAAPEAALSTTKGAMTKKVAGR